MRRARVLELSLLGAVLVAQAVLFARPIHSATNYDEDVYLAALDALRHGQALGTDVFAAQFPGFYELLRGLSFVTGVGVTAVRGGLIAVTLAGTVGGWLVGRRFGGATGGLLVAALLVVAPPLDLFSFQVIADTPALALTLLALGVATLPGTVAAVAAGLLFGAALSVKLTALTAAPAALWLIRKRIWPALAGFAALWLVLLVGHARALGDLWSSGVTYHDRARSTPAVIPHPHRQILDQIPHSTPFFWLAILAAAIGLFHLALRRPLRVWPLWSWVVLALAFLLIHKPLHYNHLIEFPFTLAVAVGATLGATLERQRPPVRSVLIGLLALALLAGFVQQWHRTSLALVAEPSANVAAAHALERANTGQCPDHRRPTDHLVPSAPPRHGSSGRPRFPALRNRITDRRPCDPRSQTGERNCSFALLALTPSHSRGHPHDLRAALQPWRRADLGPKMIDERDHEGVPATPAFRGLRAGAIVFLGVAALNAGNYLFHLISARRLGPARYGDLATLIAIAGLISLPLGGVQLWVARHVAQYQATGDDDAAHWFVHRVGRYLVICAAFATILLLAMTGPIQHALGIASPAAVAIMALTAFPAIVSPVTWGLAQGLERFGLTSLVYAIGPVVRIGFTLLAFGIGLHVGGAMLATLLSMMVALALPVWVLRRWVGSAPTHGRRINRGEAFRSLIPVMVGLFAITALTTGDVVVAKVVLTEHAAGIYGTASLVGRVVLYLPAAIVTVLLPRVAARAAGQRDTRDLLVKSIVVTLAFCTALTLVYAAEGQTIMRLAFGVRYESAAPLLWRFGVAMTGFALLNVLLVYHLAHHRSSAAWLLAGGVVLQLAGFALFHQTALQLVTVDIAVAALLLIAHELAISKRLAFGDRRRGS